MNKNTLVMIGSAIAVVGAATTILGTIANSFMLDHMLAMWIWLLSNPIMLIWAVGYTKGYWDDGLSGAALIGLYSALTIMNAYGLYIGYPSLPVATICSLPVGGTV